jgi:ribulose 1,5-bisphosphate synthetase/thiazole synthase
MWIPTLSVLAFSGIAATVKGNVKGDDIVAKVAIIGGGVSGIIAAKTLEEGDVTDWTILEAAGRLVSVFHVGDSVL